MTFPARLVRGQPMWADNDLLGEPRGVAAYDYIGGSHDPRYLGLDRLPGRCDER
jgi:hypothetical protein